MPGYFHQPGGVRARAARRAARASMARFQRARARRTRNVRYVPPPPVEYVVQKRIIDDEVHYVDAEWQATNVPKAGTPYRSGMLITVDRSATGPTNRIGNKITVKHYFFRMEVKLLPQLTSSIVLADMSPQNVRILIVYDKDPNKAAPNLNEVLDDTKLTVDYNGVDMFRKLENVSRFEILYDKTITLKRRFQQYSTTGANCITGGDVRNIDIKLTNLNKVVKYDPTSVNGTISDVVYGSFILFVWKDSGVNDGEVPFSGMQRARFTP
jgi:hypothetical protein